MSPKYRILVNDENGSTVSMPVKKPESITILLDDGTGSPPEPMVTVTKSGEMFRPKTCHKQGQEKKHNDFFAFLDEQEQALGEAAHG